MDQVWKARFGGDESSKKEEEAPTSKRKAKKAAGTNAVVMDSGPKSPEAIALNAKILEQGRIVRRLKENKEPKDLVDVALTELKRLKGELVLLEKPRNPDMQ
jgi:methionyl-tRNA synthetase